MFWITGDIHFPIDWNRIRSWYKHNPNFTKGDTIIICGDAGFLWDNSTQEKELFKKFLNYLLRFYSLMETMRIFLY